jgi:diguanylate cyclase (GGDEF)-like protein
MLGTLELDQILHIILSGLTHGEGLNFNRAILFLYEPGRRRLRASYAVGPATAEQAFRIWEEMTAQELHLEGLLGTFQKTPPLQDANGLAFKVRGLVVPVPDEAPSLDDIGGVVPVGRLVSRCAVLQQPYFSNTIKAEFVSPHGMRLEFSHVACVPMVVEDRLLGVILVDNVFNGREIRRGEMRSLSTMANLAAIAIDRAYLHRQLQEMASKDGLTGVFNRRHYEERLAEAVVRSRRHGVSLTMLMIDLDYFKACNDQHGHETGDQVLKDVAATLVEGVRAADLVARWGGEEFAVLLDAGCSEEEGMAVAEKLRSRVAERSQGGLRPGKVTISIGVASGQDLGTGSQLFRDADFALYRAKQLGRNRVVAASDIVRATKAV